MTVNLSNITLQAYKQLKSELITCKLPPGKRIIISKLQRETGYSQSAIREALSRLISEGLVVAELNSGFKATAILTTGFRELAEASLVLEVPCLESAIENGDIDWEGKLVACYHVSSKLLPSAIEGKVDLSEYMNNREAFYDILFSPCQNQWLIKAWKSLYLQQLRYRNMFYKLACYEAGLTDHYQLFLQAICDRNTQRAVQLCREQYQAVIHFMEKNDIE